MTVTDRISDLSLLWKQASIVFPYFDRVGDWDQTYQEFLPKVMEAEDDQEFHLLFAEFMNRLGDGHTDYLLPRDLIERTGYLPFSLMYIDGRYYIRAIEEQGKAHLLTEVLRINGAEFKDILAEAFRYIYHVGDYAYPSKLSQILPFLLKKTGNEMITAGGTYLFDLAEAKPSMVECSALNASKSFERIGCGKLDIRMYEGNLLYIKLDNFLYAGAADEIRQAADEITKATGNPGSIKGVIFDLRENIGGMTMYGAKVAELFISGQFHAGQKRTRKMSGIDVAVASQFARMSDEEIANIRWEREEVEKCQKINRNAYFEEYLNDFGSPDHKRMFDQPCVILTSRNTISAAEDFIVMFKDKHRATIIGTATHGSTGTPLLMNLSCGGRARVCSVGYKLMDGTEFIGCGIMPDIQMENRIEDYRLETDCVLDTAIHFLV